VEKIHHTWSFGSDATVLDDYVLTTTTTTLLLPKFLMGFVSIDPICAYNVPNLKFRTLPVPEIIGGGTQNIWIVPGYARALFFRKF